MGQSISITSDVYVYCSDTATPFELIFSVGLVRTNSRFEYAGSDSSSPAVFSVLLRVGGAGVAAHPAHAELHVGRAHRRYHSHTLLNI